ncbi:MAG: cytidylate kinase-like family protein, partial [Gammaproteobacteria bacterium]|nr:cytidylate kinase-like family protein [Gammaproteobacteria bacterium]
MAIITISRGSLSGGRAVAECLANELGYHCVAREIVRGAARRIGVSEDAVKEKFETAPGLWSQLFRERKLYVAAVQTALADRCVEGNLVYHGLAGQFLLRGLPGVLRVRLVAPLEFRIRALLSERDHLSREAAEKFIDNIDQERSRRVRRMYDMDVEDPALYDLTVNLRIMSEG